MRKPIYYRADPDLLEADIDSASEVMRIVPPVAVIITRDQDTDLAKQFSDNVFLAPIKDAIAWATSIYDECGHASLVITPSDSIIDAVYQPESEAC